MRIKKWCSINLQGARQNSTNKLNNDFLGRGVFRGGIGGTSPPYFEGQLPIPQNFKIGKEKREKDERKRRKEGKKTKIVI